jgi:hypothetical protein
VDLIGTTAEPPACRKPCRKSIGACRIEPFGELNVERGEQVPVDVQRRRDRRMAESGLDRRGLIRLPAVRPDGAKAENRGSYCRECRSECNREYAALGERPDEVHGMPPGTPTGPKPLPRSPRFAQAPAESLRLRASTALATAASAPERPDGPDTSRSSPIEPASTSPVHGSPPAIGIWPRTRAASSAGRRRLTSTTASLASRVAPTWTRAIWRACARNITG